MQGHDLLYVQIRPSQVILISNVWNIQQSSLTNSFRLLLPLSEKDHLQQVSGLVFLHYCCAHVRSIFCLLFTNFFHRLYNMMFIYCIHTKNRCCVNFLFWTVWYLWWRLHHPSSMFLRDRVIFAYLLWWMFPFKFTVVFPLLNCFIIYTLFLQSLSDFNFSFCFNWLFWSLFDGFQFSSSVSV